MTDAPVTPHATALALADALAECADELEGEIAARYGDVEGYPSQETRKAQDMDTVTRARAALALYRGQA